VKQGLGEEEDNNNSRKEKKGSNLLTNLSRLVRSKTTDKGK
jgi:hypothetical protein